MNNFWSELINNPANFVTFLSSIGTLITAYFTYRSIREIKRQRESSYKPELYFERTYFKLISPDFKNEYPSFTYLNQRKEKKSESIKKKEYPFEYDDETFLPPEYSVPIYIKNIGLGTAKRIKAKWECDFSKIINLFTRISTNSNLIFSKASISSKTKPRYIIEDEDLAYMKFIEEWDMNDENEIDIIVKENYTDLKSNLRIPNSWLNTATHLLVYKYNLFYSNYKGSFIEDFKELPTLILELHYQDIQDKFYKKKFELSISFYSTHIDFEHMHSKLINIGSTVLGDYILEIHQIT